VSARRAIDAHAHCLYPNDAGNQPMADAMPLDLVVP
jgi:hypothetical protein